jgi:ubiquinone biosynthesis protein
VSVLVGIGLWLPVVAVLAWAGSRLLGVRPSAVRAGVAGVLGAVAGVGLAEVIAADRGDAGHLRNVALFSLLFTMSAVVWLDLLARPGALARAQTRLVSVPRPVRAARLRARRVSRYAQITRIAARHGLAPALGLGRRSDAGRGGEPPAGVRLRRALEDCGGVFVKLGQVLSTRGDLLPPAVAAELARLQDAVPPAHPAEVSALVAAELGAPVSAVFAEFDERPLAAASIGQAHRARLPSGESVVVKVQRPGIEAAIGRDLAVLDQVARVAEERTGWGRRYRLTELAGEFAARLREELDFRLEARAATEIGGTCAPRDAVRVPRVYDELTTRRVLTQEWLDGVGVAAAGTALDGRAEELADGLLRCVLAQMLIDGRFHADPHPGNVLLLRDGRLGLIDFGAAGRLDVLQQAGLRDLFLAIGSADPAALREAVLAVAEPRGDSTDEELERALSRFAARHLAPGSTPSAAMLTELLQLCFSFELTLQPELVTMFRALVTLEGTLRVICPGYAAIGAAQRIVAEWSRERLTPGGLEAVARAELLRVLPLLRRLPARVDGVLRQAERGQLRARISLLADDRDVRVLSRLVNRVVLAFLGGAVALLSAILLVSDGGPAFTGTTTLFQFFGYFGMFCATVLILRVLVAVLREESRR